MISGAEPSVVWGRVQGCRVKVAASFKRVNP